MARSTERQAKALLSEVRKRIGVRSNDEVFGHLRLLGEQMKAELAAASNGTISGLGFSPYADGIWTYGIVYASRRGGMGNPLIPVSVDQMLDPSGLAAEIAAKYAPYVEMTTDHQDTDDEAPPAPGM